MSDSFWCCNSFAAIYCLQINIVQLRDRLCQAHGELPVGPEAPKSPYERRSMPKGRVGPAAGQMPLPQVPAQQYYQQVNGFCQAGWSCSRILKWMDHVISLPFPFLNLNSIHAIPISPFESKLICAAFPSVQMPPLLFFWKQLSCTLSRSLVLLLLLLLCILKILMQY